jgi:hypothetical protein
MAIRITHVRDLVRLNLRGRTRSAPDLAVRVLAASQVDARCVCVDAHGVRDEAGELPGQSALSTSDVQYALASWPNGFQDQRIVMDVVVPPLIAPRHAR